jgi:hypothetical protein
MPELIKVDKLCNLAVSQDIKGDSVIWEPNMSPAKHSHLVKEIEVDDVEAFQYFANLSTAVINQLDIDALQ